jgi:hypothetical protein
MFMIPHYPSVAFGSTIDTQVNDFVMKSGHALLNVYDPRTGQELQYAAQAILDKIEDFRRSNAPWLSNGQKAMARVVIFRAKALCYQADVASTRIDHYDALMF